MRTETKISFAALIVSIMSFVLSQFQPIHTYLQEPEIEITPSKQISISHQWGNLELGHYLQARNIGDGTGTIYKIEYFIKSEDSKYRKRFETNFISVKPTSISPGQNSPLIPFVPITLKPSEVWDNMMISVIPLSLAEESKAMELADRIRKQYQNIQPDGPDKSTKKSNAQQSADTSTQEARGFVEGNLEPFVSGKYHMLMMLWFDQTPTPSYKALYEFTVFEHNAVTLKNTIDEWVEWLKQGPTYISKGPTNIMVNLIEVKDSSTISKMYESYRAQ